MILMVQVGGKVIILLQNNDWETRSFYINRWMKIPESQRFMHPEKGMSLVLQGGFAYHTHPEISYPYVERHFDDRKICELQEVHLIKPLQLSLFVHANSSLTEMFRAGFTKLSEVGIRFRQVQLWTAQKPICRTDVLTADSITIKEVAPAIIFLFFSMLVSGTLLSIEFLYSTYCKGVVSARLNNRFRKINDSLDRLIEMDLSIASERSLYFDFHMKKNDVETRSFYLNKWLKIPERKRFIPTDEGFNLVSQGGFAYHTVPEVAYPFVERYFNKRKICELTEIHLVRPTKLYFLAQTNNSFTEMLKFGFAKITESGVRNRQIKRWLARKPFCRVDVLTIEEVALNEIAPAFIFLALSAFLSWIVLGVEQASGVKLSSANLDNFFIVSYFKYKTAGYVVGFSCSDVQGDIDLTKNFSDIGIFSSVTQLHVNFTIKPFLYTLYRRLGIFLDLRCYTAAEAKYLLNKASSATVARLYGEQHYWLILGNNYSESISMLNDTEFGISTDLVVAIAEGANFSLYDAFNLCKYRGGKLNITQLGTWNNITGFNITLTQSKFRRRANFHGMNLRMAGLVTSRPKDVPLEEYLQDYSTKQNDSMPKFTYAVWLHLSDFYNFTPLASAAWFLTVMLIAIAVLVFAWVLVAEHISDKFERYSAAFLFTIGSVCQQGNHEDSSTLHTGLYEHQIISITGSDLQITHISCRIAFLQTMLFSLLIYNYYSASVVSARLSEPLEKINDSLNELAKTSLKFGAEPSLYFNFFIKRSDWEAQQFYYKRWIKVPENEKFMSPAIGIRRILQGDFAYHTDVNVAYPMIEKLFDNQQTCQLTSVYLIRPTDSSIFVASNSSFVELIKVGVAKIRETGLRARLVKRWAARTPECRTDILVIDPISIYEAAPAFLLLVFGMVLGITICSIERI
ncbi:hypothetical protein TSAR_009461, partial [Trichomalopsis sarcophagae]